MITLSDIRSAAKRIAPYVHRTPVLTSLSLNEIFNAELFFKAENLQKVGAFKARGANNAVLLLADEVARKGVAAHSSGNHAQALAYAARSRGIPCTIVMPEGSPQVKINATEQYGARIVFCENTLAARETKLLEVLTVTGATEIHPYDNDNVIAGQGTAALELLDDHPDIEVVMAPIGGGGLMSGTAVASRGLIPSVEIIGVEPKAADDAQRSMETGTIQPPLPPTTIADGLRTGLSERTFQHLTDAGVSVHTCSEDNIARGMQLVMERLKTVIEPSAAVTIGVMLEHPEIVRGKRVGIILCGGNLDLSSMGL
jgi:threonine dehydratase